MPIAALLATLAGIAGSLEVMYGAFAVGGALLAVSVLLLRGPWSIWNATPPAELSPRIRRAAIIAVFALAAFFRFYRLNPPGLWGDDAINGLLAFDVLDGKIRSPFQIVPHSHSYFHGLDLAMMVGMGEMPIVKNGVQQSAAIYQSIGITLTLGLGAVD